MAQEFIERIEGTKKSRLAEFDYLGYGSLPAIKEKSVEALTGEYGLANQAGNAYFQTSGFVDAARKVGLSESLIGKIQGAENRLNLNETLDVATAMLRDASSNNQVNWETDILGNNGFISKLEGFGLDANLAHSGLQFVKEAMSQQGGCSFTLDANEWNTDLVHQLAVEMTEREWENIPSSPRRLPMTEAPIRDDMAWLQQATGAIPASVNLYAGGGANAGGAGNGVAKAEAVTAAPMKAMAVSGSSKVEGGTVLVSGSDWKARDGQNAPPFLSAFSSKNVKVVGDNIELSYNGVGAEVESDTIAELTGGDVFGTYQMKYTPMNPEDANRFVVGSAFTYLAKPGLKAQSFEGDLIEQNIQSLDLIASNRWLNGQQLQSATSSRSVKVEPGKETTAQIKFSPGRMEIWVESGGQMVKTVDEFSDMVNEKNVGDSRFFSNIWLRGFGLSEGWQAEKNNPAKITIGPVVKLD
ncbi:hypothetical protein [Limnobacter parvus]|uniref:Uncharacterized protein n=1 Tax=Limnobacter parvus TaxID=2939690 RepID=A0ABT1XFW4_9BURK|nr:hypothetical protein [Limnobacter parvus]MCR2746188.1 hypothetical protein [Limnobacter parvus]